MPPLSQVTKVAELKELQHHVNKARIMHHRRSTQLDELHGATERMELKSMEETTRMKEESNTV